MKLFTDLRKQLIEFDYPQIYCDMDGVVADFLKFTKDHLGHAFKDNSWAELPLDTYAQLPLMPDARILWNYISKFDPIMLTAIPKPTRGPISLQAGKDKTDWMKRHFNLSPKDMRVVYRQDKKKFAKDGRDGRPNLLIDDDAGNIKEFKNAGGLGIVHTSAESTIRELKRLGYP